MYNVEAVVQNGNWEKIKKETFSFLDNNKERKFVRNIEEKNRQSERIDGNSQHKNKEGKDDFKKIQEMVDKIKRTGLYVKFVNDKGIMRAHIINRVTRQLVAIIPWYMQNSESFSGNNSSNIISEFNSQVISFYSAVSLGGEVDTKI